MSTASKILGGLAAFFFLTTVGVIVFGVGTLDLAMKKIDEQSLVIDRQAAKIAEYEKALGGYHQAVQSLTGGR